MNKKSLSKKILKGLLMAGTIYVAASSPYFAFHLSRNFLQVHKKKNYLKAKRSQFDNAFYYLKRKGYLNIEEENKQIYISLTKEGKKKANKCLIDDLEIIKPETWDGKWRIVIFDIPNETKIVRETLRGKLRELGFYKLQQSVWIHPFNCKKEVEFLRKFFGLNSQKLKLIIGKIENDTDVRNFFKI